MPLASSGIIARPLSHVFFPRPASVGDRILVIINLNGGNDGLNTIVPFNDPIYATRRPSIGLKKADTLPITADLGLHNAMTGMEQLYSAGEMAIVQSVGYPDQDRSHFRSTDIWHTSSDADKILFTGWLGRYLEKMHPEYPTTLPTAPYAIQIASAATLALQGNNGSMGIAIDNPDRFYNLAAGLKVDPEPLPPTLAGPELQYVRDIIEQSNFYSSAINKAMIDGTTNGIYDADAFSAQLKVAARLINGGLETSIYVVTLGGFDTHFGQLQLHSQRLTQLSRGISSFLADITAAGNADRVACMTYSEFGRRLNENGSLGTDHGAAAPQFVMGEKVLGGKVIGGVPNLTDLDSRGDIKWAIDFRQIYASVLEDWMGLSRTDTNLVLGGEFQKLPLFPAASPGSVDHGDSAPAGMVLAESVPNPASQQTAISFTIPHGGYTSLNVFAANGTLAMRAINRTLEAGAHKLDLDVSGLPPGSYFYRLDLSGYRLTKKFIVAR
jgi:uncharacterized protein (DUF1501 family)